MNTLCAVLISALVGPASHAELKLTKDGQSKVILTFFDNFTASIVDQGRKESLIEGKTILDEKGNVVIRRAEGDVCPNVKITFRPDLLRGDQAAADVVVMIDEAGTAARSADCDVTDLAGRYTRAE